MDDARPTDPASLRGAETPSNLGDRRRRARELLAAQFQALETLDQKLSAELQQVTSLAAGDTVADLPQDWKRVEELARQGAELAQLREELAQREAAVARAEALDQARTEQLDKRERELAIRLAEHTTGQAALEESQRRTEGASNQTTQRLRDIEQQQELLRKQQQELRSAQEELRKEREQLAKQRVVTQIEQEEATVKTAQLARGQQQLEVERQQLNDQLDQLAAEQTTAQIAAEQLAIDQQQFARLRERFDEDHKQLESQRAEIKAIQDEAEAARSEFSRALERVEASRQHVEAERERVMALETKTNHQRRSIAREFQVQRAKHLAELQRLKEEMHAEQPGENRNAQDQVASAQEEAHTEREQSAQLRRLLNARSEELRELRGHAAKLADQLESLRAEHQSLKDQQNSNAVDKEAATGSADLERRLQLAIEELREQKRHNTDLETRLAKSGGGRSLDTGGIALDWESQKRRLLASLENDGQEEEDDSNRGSFSQDGDESGLGAIHVSDEMLAEKDRRILELEQLLAENSAKVEPVPDAALLAVLDQDEIVCQERERLAELQAQWTEKMRQAEIDISLERARVARDRSTVEDKQANLKAEISEQKARGNAPTDPKGNKPPRGRWLTRLGLKEPD